MLLHKNLAKALSNQKNHTARIRGYTQSAVLVPLIQRNGKYNILFTQRTEKVRDHKNQISFPGGVREKEDRDLLVTALRESEEEIGLLSQEVEVLGSLRDIYTPTRYRITPYVGIIPANVPLYPNPTEIQEIFQVPLKHLLDPKNLTVESADFFDREFDVPFFRYKNHTIWGATGRITRDLMELLKKIL